MSEFREKSKLLEEQSFTDALKATANICREVFREELIRLFNEKTF